MLIIRTKHSISLKGNVFFVWLLEHKGIIICLNIMGIYSYISLFFLRSFPSRIVKFYYVAIASTIYATCVYARVCVLRSHRSRFSS